jgi:CHAT domain-containing protein
MASDMFGVDIKTSSITLLACGSARAEYNSSELLGIVSALLCAGATSVISPMWKVDARTAAVITDELDNAINDPAGGSSDAAIIDLATTIRDVVLEMKTESETGSLYHWASLILHGSWFMSRRGAKANAATSFQRGDET